METGKCRSPVPRSLAMCGQVGEVAEAEQEVQDPGDDSWPQGTRKF